MKHDRGSYQETWNRALRLLSLREHSEKELTAKLLSKGVEVDTVTQVITDLKERDYLSDQRFTEMFVRSRIERGQGPRKIHQELTARGVREDLIDRFMDQSESTWETVLYRVWSKKFGEKMPGNYEEWAKQARFLQSRGFTTEQIRKVVSWQ